MATYIYDCDVPMPYGVKMIRIESGAPIGFKRLKQLAVQLVKEQSHQSPISDDITITITVKHDDRPSDIEILSCPFCGGTDIKVESTSPGGVWWCVCEGCGVVGPPTHSKKQAMHAWNGTVQRHPANLIEEDE